MTLVAGLAGAAPAAVLAQQVAAPVQPDTTVVEAPVPIDPGAIPARADVVAADVRRIEDLIRPDRAINRIEAVLDARDITIVALLARLDSIDAERISIRRVEDQRLPWLELRTEVEGWAAVVQARFADLQRERERIGDERSLWELTLEGADDAEIPQELVGRIENTLTRLGDVEVSLREARDGVSFLVERIATTREQIAESVRRLAELDGIVRAGLLDRSETQFGAALSGLDSGQLNAGFRRAVDDWWQSLAAHATYKRGWLSLLLIVYGVILMQTLRLRRSNRSRAADAEGDSTWRKLAERPFSLALALALAAASLVLSPTGALRDLEILVSVVPVARIGAVVLDAAAQRALYGTVALALIAVFLGLDFGLGTEQLTLLCAAIIAFGVAMWLTVHTHRATGEKRGWARVARAVTIGGTTLLGVALIADLFGWAGLARMLTVGTGERLYAAMAWMIVVVSVSAVAPVGLSGTVARAMPRLAERGARNPRLLRRAFTLLAVLVWTRGTLARFEVWQPLRDFAATITGSGLSIGGLRLSTGGLLGAILILGVARLVAQGVALVVREEILPRTSMKSGAATSALTLTTYAIYGVGAVLAASAVGLGGTQLTVVIGALGVGIGFGLQNIVNNFVSGLILMFERPISVGDTVQTTNHWGKVERIGIRASTIRSYDGAEIIVPNGDLVSREIINWTRSDEIRRVEVLVGIAYGSEPTEVLDILSRVAADHPKVLSEPAPKAHMIRFGDSSLDFRLRCWVWIEHWIDVIGDLHLSINEQLKEAGIRIPFPQRDVHVYPTVEDVDPFLRPTPPTTSAEEARE